MEQRCFNRHDVGIYTVLQGSYSQIKIKIPDLQNRKRFADFQNELTVAGRAGVGVGAE